MTGFDPEAIFLALAGARVDYRRLFEDLRALALEVDGTPIVVASRNDLIRLKAGTGRDRDLLDIGDLLALEE